MRSLEIAVISFFDIFAASFVTYYPKHHEQTNSSFNFENSDLRFKLYQIIGEEIICSGNVYIIKKNDLK